MINARLPEPLLIGIVIRQTAQFGERTLKTEGDTQVIVTRRFAVPREAVYCAHTDPNLIQKWLLGPEDWTMPDSSMRPDRAAKSAMNERMAKGGGFISPGSIWNLSPTTAGLFT